MNVLVIAQYFPPDIGGGSTRASNVVSGLIRKGCKITVVAAFPHYPHGRIPRSYKNKAIVAEHFANAKVYRVWIPAVAHNSPVKRVFLHLCFVFSSLFALPFIENVDVVWGANPNLFSFFSSVIYGAIKQAPIVRNVDDLWPEVFYELGLVKSRIAQKLLDLIAWFSYTVPKAITPISEGYKRSIVAKYGLSPRKLHVVRVGVSSSNDLAPRLISKKHKQFVVMYSGAIGLSYDFAVVLKAAQFLNRNKEIVFVIRGVGELVPALRQSINSFGLNNVVLSTSFLSKSELANELAFADVFVLPMAAMNCIDLGLPTKVFEYQAYGKPIICVSGGEAARYVESTKSGIIVKPADASGFAEAVVKLHASSRLRAELGLNGRKYVSKNLTSLQIGTCMYRVFDSLI